MAEKNDQMDAGSFRVLICQAAQQLWMRGLLVGQSGIITVEEHRRRYLVTPPGVRRSVLTPEDLVVVDVGGADISGTQVIDADIWMPHRLAYQEGTNSDAQVHATVEASPPMTIALARSMNNAPTLDLPGLPAIAVVMNNDEQSIRNAVDAHQVIILNNTSIVSLAPDLAGAMNMLEAVEHASTIELASRGKG